MTYGELSDQLGIRHPRAFLYCQDCQERYSAHRGDYFLQAESDLIVCGNCASDDVMLAREECRIVAAIEPRP